MGRLAKRSHFGGRLAKRSCEIFHKSLGDLHQGLYFFPEGLIKR